MAARDGLAGLAGFIYIMGGGLPSLVNQSGWEEQVLWLLRFGKSGRNTLLWVRSVASILIRIGHFLLAYARGSPSLA